MTQAEKARRFRELHAGPGAFILANAWDRGSATVLATLGYHAVATSSGAFAGTLGRKDGQVTRDEALAHARDIIAAVDLPVSADFENGFGDDPAYAAETVQLAAQAGLVGCSIEDATGDPDHPLYDIDYAIKRIAACVEAARAVDFPFTLTARTESYVRNIDDLEDVIARLQAFEAAGADVLMAPGLPTLAAVKAVCDAVSKPVNFMVGIPGKSFTHAELEQAGVRRISLAASLYRAAMKAMVAAAKEVKDNGTFNYLNN